MANNDRLDKKETEEESKEESPTFGEEDIERNLTIQRDDGEERRRNVVDKTSKSSSSETSLFLRWVRLEKSVQVAHASSGLLRSSIAGQLLPSEAKPGKAAAKNRKGILNQVSGYAAPGQILALIGPSGSGKTTLLNALCGRTAIDHGLVSVNAKPIISNDGKSNSTQNQQQQDYLKRRFVSKIAYVQQEDIFFAHLTVRDQLIYTAFLRLPREWSRSQKLEEVDSVIRLLRLTKVKQSPIRFLSGGEKKRVNIGTELLTNPSCLLLDEPTSGLDSTSAVALVRMVSKLARYKNKTVVMSIHQPSSGIFLSFDSLLVLAEGNVVYFGTPLGSIDYLKEKNLAKPEGYNGADHWMDLLVSDSSTEEEEDGMYSTSFLMEEPNSAYNVSKQELRRRKQPNDDPKLQSLEKTSTTQQLINAWNNDALAEIVEASITSIRRQASDDSGLGRRPADGSVPRKYNATWLKQYQILVHRALKNSRSAIFTSLNMSKSAAIGIVAGFLWFQLDYTEYTVHDRASYVFFTMTYWIIDSMIGSVLAFPAERKVIFKELASGSYHLSAYFVAKTTSEAPTRLALPLIYMITSFFIAGINPRFVVFLSTTCVSLMSALAGESLGLLMGASINQIDRALTSTTILALAMMLLGGFYVENIPSFLSWTKYLSPFKYSFDASRILVFDRDVPCDGSGRLKELCQNLETEFIPKEAILEYLDIQGTLAFNIGMLVVVTFVPRYGAYVALRANRRGGR